MSVQKRQILRYAASDGFEIDALLSTPQAATERRLAEIPVIINIHGVLGNFLARGTPKTLPIAMLEKGYSTLSINTRMAFLGQIVGTGIFHKAAGDVASSVEILKKQGFKNIFILGYSMGANIAVDYAAQCDEPSVKGLILEGCSYSLPESQKKRLEKWGSIPTYENVWKKAKAILGADPENSGGDQIFVIYRAWGDSLNPRDVEIFTYKTWWFMRSPDAVRAKTCGIISEVRRPALFINGENDDIVLAGEPEKLKEIMKLSGSEAQIEYIPNAGHDCMENPEKTADVIDRWIQKRFSEK